MTTSLASPQPAARSRLGTRIASFTPLGILIVASVASPTYFPAFMSKPPDMLGFPLGVVMQGIAMLWMVLGAAIAWSARSRWLEAFALIVFTIPATLVVVFTPAIIVIMQNL
jgi:hypothetical protein